MPISLLAALAGTVLALAGLIMLAIRCSRTPRVDMFAWAGAMLGLLVALAAQVAGFASGFGPGTFRAVQLGAQVVATLGLALALAQVAARSLPVRFAARLVVSALAVVALVILATDPLSTAAFSKTFPAVSLHYQPISASLLHYGLAPFTAVIAVIALVVTAVRARQHPAWRATFPVVAAGAVAALILAAPGLAYLAAKTSLGAAFPFVCIVAAALTWLAAVRASGLRLDVVHRSSRLEGTSRDGGRGSWDGPETGEFDPYTDGGGYAAGGFATRPAAGGRAPASSPYAGPGLLPAGAPGAPGARPGGPAMPATHDHEAWSQLFGQIAIYTLLEGTVEPFDSLIGAVVGQVRSGEPGTLVYIVHEVPSAPLQRILYEVYRDRDAHEAHKRQPYVAQFELDCRPYVLATNVIELGLQQAKVSQLPALAEMLGRSGAPAAQAPVPGSPAPMGYPPPASPAASPAGRPAQPGPAPLPGYSPGGHRPPAATPPAAAPPAATPPAATPATPAAPDQGWGPDGHPPPATAPAGPAHGWGPEGQLPADWAPSGGWASSPQRQPGPQRQS